MTRDLPDGLPLGGPPYGRGTLSDVLVSAASALGSDLHPNAHRLPPAAGYVVLLVDGLGWELLREHAAAAPYLGALAEQSAPATCGIPSTTATSLTSLGTGLPPGGHGVVGYTSRIPGTDRLLDALRWSADVDPREWQPRDTVFAAARRAGLSATTVSKRAFEGSGLTVASQRGATYVGADTVGERVEAVAEAAAAPGSLVYVYDGEVDAVGHRSGCESWAWEHQLSMADAFAQRLRDALPAGAGLVVTADHGMIDIPADARIDVDAEPDLLAGVQLVGGEARFRHLYCRAGAVDDVAAAWRARLGAAAVVVTRDDAVGRGWFGEVDGRVRPRLGDVMVACVDDIAVVSSTAFPHEARLVGFHGSLTTAEMLVPVLVDVRG